MSNSRWALGAPLVLAALGGQCRRTASSAPGSAATGGVARSADSVAIVAVVAPGDAAPPFAAKAVKVPASLVDESGQLELSGLAYSAAINRYIVVSDDTGRKDKGTRHAPWLFTMSASGEVDPDPLPIGGIDRLNDPESITAGPPGTFFICTSHSANLKGHTPPERAMLLQVEQTGRSLRALARLDLREIEGGSLLELAGLDPNGRLDIEGVAYRDGELLIGLKSPLTADGAATVLGLAHPVEALKRGKLARGDISVRARLRLGVSSPSGDVSEGISDLLYLPDSSLVVLAIPQCWFGGRLSVQRTQPA